jgi:hypothetical protein
VGGTIQQNDHAAAQMAQPLAQKQANLFPPDIVEEKLVVQTQVVVADLPRFRK